MSGAPSPILVTGAAGFIGFHVARRLLDRGDSVIGLDNVNNYYDIRLKEARLAKLIPLLGGQALIELPKLLTCRSFGLLTLGSAEFLGVGHDCFLSTLGFLSQLAPGRNLQLSQPQTTKVGPAPPRA